MLLELYLALLILNFVVFGIAFFRKNVIFWAIGLVLSAFLIFASYNIVQNTAVVDNQTSPSPGIVHYEYKIIENSTQDTALSWTVIGLFLIELLLFLWDMFGGLKDKNLGERELD